MSTVAAVRGAEGTRRDEPSAAGLYRLHIGELWRAFWSQEPAFWLLCLYVFIEYVRPQSMYPVLDVLPWGMLTLALVLGARMLQPRAGLLGNGQTWLLMALWIVILLSWATAFRPWASIDHMKFLLNWFLLYGLILTTVTSERRFLLFLLLYFLWNFKMSQHGATTWAGRGFGYSGWGVAGAPGWFGNSGEFGTQMVIFASLSFCFWMGIRHHVGRFMRTALLLLPLTAVMSVIASSARGNLLALAAAAIWLVLSAKRTRGRALLFGAVAAVAAYALVPPEFLADFQTAGEDNTSIARLTRWKAGLDILAENPWFGIGPGNWMEYYPMHYPRESSAEGWGIPHNIFIDVAAGYGYTGLILFAAMILCMFLQNRKTRRLALEMDSSPLFWLARGFDAATVGFFAGAMFMSIFWYPMFWLQAALVAVLHGVTVKRHVAWQAQPDDDREAAAEDSATTSADRPGAPTRLLMRDVALRRPRDSAPGFGPRQP